MLRRISPYWLWLLLALPRSCCGVLPRANKLRRSMSSPRHFPAHRPALGHAYTFSRAGSFMQARVPWTRPAPLLFACCHDTLSPHSTLSLLETMLMRTSHSHMALGSLSIMHSTTTTHTLPYQQSLPHMACAAWVVLLHNSLLLPGGMLWHTLTISCRPALQTTFTPPHMNILN